MLEGGAHSSGIKNRMHLSMHRYGLAMAAMLRLAAIIVRSVVVESSGDNLAALHEYSAKRKTHRALRRRRRTLRQVKIGLVHCDGRWKAPAKTNELVRR